jgi:hypothetical protein
MSVVETSPEAMRFRSESYSSMAYFRRKNSKSSESPYRMAVL